MTNVQSVRENVRQQSTIITKHILTNGNGMMIEVLNLGGIITSLTAPDKNGIYKDIVLGYTDTEKYICHNHYYFGAIIGRYANRISNSKFVLEGKTFELNANNGRNSIHGGNEGFHTKFWQVETICNIQSSTLKLTYVSAAGEEGFLGTLTTSVFYTLTDDDALEILYEAQTDQITVINLSQHTYFNLSGNFNKVITDHELQINACEILEIDQNMIPTGRKYHVKDTPFDFTVSKTIGKDIDSENKQLSIGNGYDHNWILDGEGLRSVAKVYEPKTGRLMEVFTDQPGIQFYSGNHLNGKFTNKTGGKNEPRTGFCLETQHFPDSPNQPSFPSTVLKPGMVYRTKTIYKFSGSK